MVAGSLLLLTGLCASCTRESGWAIHKASSATHGANSATQENRSATPQPPASDYPVYAAVLRTYFMGPLPDADGDGEPQVCEITEPVSHINIVRQTMLRRRPGRGRDSALVAEVPPRVAPLFAALRALSAEPARSLHADSFGVAVPVTLVASTRYGRGLDSPITLSRVAYSADGSDAMLLAVKPCNGAREMGMEPGSDESSQGLAVLVVLHRERDAWAVRNAVYLDAE